MDRPADLCPEDVVDEAMLLHAAEAVEGIGGDGGAEVIAAAGVVLDVGVRSRDGCFDALLDVLR
jgi:hypothetical protein